MTDETIVTIYDTAAGVGSSVKTPDSDIVRVTAASFAAGSTMNVRPDDVPPVELRAYAFRYRQHAAAIVGEATADAYVAAALELEARADAMESSKQ
jgi:hypothetical protein